MFEIPNYFLKIFYNLIELQHLIRINYQYYQNVENELREFLGFGNVGVGEKKEHLINAEVDANNAIIEANKECLLDSMKEFFERVKEVLGIEITIELKEPVLPELEDFDSEDEEDLENA